MGFNEKSKPTKRRWYNRGLGRAAIYFWAFLITAGLVIVIAFGVTAYRKYDSYMDKVKAPGAAIESAVKKLSDNLKNDAADAAKKVVDVKNEAKIVANETVSTLEVKIQKPLEKLKVNWPSRVRRDYVDAYDELRSKAFNVCSCEYDDGISGHTELSDTVDGFCWVINDNNIPKGPIRLRFCVIATSLSATTTFAPRFPARGMKVINRDVHYLIAAANLSLYMKDPDHALISPIVMLRTVQTLDPITTTITVGMAGRT
ncbi:hypothetical protein K469DRAFT_84664 [Zopfia rhizophila CBS 207.26]|uniref:Uncharacterized protein n=1 Tax=Zopfia rhizophila CBS 207.26 TaxID=1314779 RepID=A0A6A6EET7_9PEZI|nr:hypothetical protein K469DRAFT_84664 [Zopfia rhizophila CBS 207.26]